VRVSHGHLNSLVVLLGPGRGAKPLLSRPSRIRSASVVDDLVVWNWNDLGGGGHPDREKPGGTIQRSLSTRIAVLVTGNPALASLELEPPKPLLAEFNELPILARVIIASLFGFAVFAFYKARGL
jgi:hypothetical protein